MSAETFDAGSAWGKYRLVTEEDGTEQVEWLDDLPDGSAPCEHEDFPYCGCEAMSAHIAAHDRQAERVAQINRNREAWFVENPDCVDIVLLATSPRANYQYLCSCGHHGTIASANLAYAREVCEVHLSVCHVDTTPADPFEGIA